MKNSFVLILCNHHYILSAKKRTNPSSIYSFPVKNLVNFGNMYSPGSGTMTFMLEEANLIFGFEV